MQLFAVAYRKKNKKTKIWEILFEYLHAEDTGEAKMMFGAANTRDIIRRKIKVIGVAPAVGFFGYEDKPQVLLA